MMMDVTITWIPKLSGVVQALGIQVKLLERIKMKTPRQYSLVKFVFDNLPEVYWDQYPFIPDRPYVFLGEIPNMEGHCIVIDHSNGSVHSGYHIENFIEMTEDDF